MSGRIFYFVFFLLFLSCNESKEETAADRTGVHAHLSTSRQNVHSLDEATLKAVIRNYGPRDTTIYLLNFENPVLAITVTNPSGEKLSSVPPSVPPADLTPFNHVLHTGDSLVYFYTLNFYEVETPAGNYRVRISSIPSDELFFTLR